MLAFAAAGLITGACNRTPPPKDMVEFFMEAPRGSGIPLTLPISGLQYSALPQPFLTEGDVANVELVHVSLGYCLMFVTTDAGQRELYRQTASNPTKRIFLFVNGKPLGVHPIEAPVTDGRLYVWVEVPDMPEKVPADPNFVPDLQESFKRAAEIKKKS
jgi:hypothetical protein